MIPIDNSIAGRVADIHHFLPDSGLHIIAEHFLRIRFSLMARPGRRPSTTITHRAQPRARARPVPQDHPRARPDPGDLRRHRRRGPRGGRARRPDARPRSRPPLAAEIYGLEILADDVEDEDHNTTRFVVLSRELVEAPAGNGPVVTSFIFNVRNLPAALYKALGGFATNGVNMTKLESYMVGGEFTATQFLAEVDGHPEDIGLKNALEELAFFTTDVKILGVYPADPFRSGSAGRAIRLNIAPCGSARIAIRPTPGTSNAGATTRAAELDDPRDRVVDGLDVEVDVPVRRHALHHRRHRAADLAAVDDQAGVRPSRRPSAAPPSRRRAGRRRTPSRPARSGEISSFQIGVPGSLARCVPDVALACQRLTRAPVGSWIADIRPCSITSNGPASTLPPRSATLAVAASTSSTAR